MKFINFLILLILICSITYAEDISIEDAVKNTDLLKKLSNDQINSNFDKIFPHLSKLTKEQRYSITKDNLKKYSLQITNLLDFNPVAVSSLFDDNFNLIRMDIAPEIKKSLKLTMQGFTFGEISINREVINDAYLRLNSNGTLIIKKDNLELFVNQNQYVEKIDDKYLIKNKKDEILVKVEDKVEITEPSTINSSEELSSVSILLNTSAIVKFGNNMFKVLKNALGDYFITDTDSDISINSSSKSIKVKKHDLEIKDNDVSIVSVLKRNNLPDSKYERKIMYEQLFPEETYTYSSDQNIKWLNHLKKVKYLEFKESSNGIVQVTPSQISSKISLVKNKPETVKPEESITKESSTEKFSFNPDKKDGTVPIFPQENKPDKNFWTLSNGLNLMEISGVNLNNIRRYGGEGKTPTSANEIDNQFSWAVVDMSTGDVISFNGNKKVNGASVTKLFNMATRFHQTNGNPSASDLRDIIPMISVSSNDAWKRVMSKNGNGNIQIGYKNNQDFLNQNGYLNSNAGMRGAGQNLVSALDAAKLFYDMNNNNIPGGEDQLKITSLCKTGGSSSSYQYIPEGVYGGGKTGSVSEIRHYAGWYKYNNNRYGVIVLSEQSDWQKVGKLQGHLFNKYVVNKDSSIPDSPKVYTGTVQENALLQTKNKVSSNDKRLSVVKN